MVDGGALTWQVGCEGHAGASKCGNVLPPGVSAAAATRPPALLRRQLSPVNVTTQAFVFVFPS